MPPRANASAVERPRLRTTQRTESFFMSKLLSRTERLPYENDVLACGHPRGPADQFLWREVCPYPVLYQRGYRNYLRAAQAYMLISMPTGTSTIFGVFQAI